MRFELRPTTASHIAVRRLRARVEAARRKARAEIPFSDSWDAAMGALEDAERDLWRLEHAEHVQA